MKINLPTAVAMAAFWTVASNLSASFTHFVTRSGDKLMDGEVELRFISTNLPDILQIIDNTPFERTHKLRLPNKYEIEDAVLTVKQMGGQVLRTFSITQKDGPSPYHLFDVSTNPVTQNEDAFQVLDKLLELCNRERVRLYIPLIAYSNSNRGDPATYGPDFWSVGSDENLRFKNMLSQLLNRTNQFTGVQYKDDKSIVAWESGNELVMGDDAQRRAWLHDIAAFVKGIDKNHLFLDGRNRPEDVYERYSEFFDDDNIDIVSYHTYLNLPSFNTPATTLAAMRQYTKGKRPLIIGEIAMYTTEAALNALLQEQIANGTSGSNWWAHRFRNRDGGYYRHSDNGSNFEDLNWPGFPELAYYHPDIRKANNLQNILADNAYQIQGIERLPLPIPTPPQLLPIPDAGHISWQNATGTQSNAIQRATSTDGPWTTLTEHFPDAVHTYERLFSDTTAEVGESYYYRILGKNTSGTSEPSNIQGPVLVRSRWLIDDLFDLEKTADSSNVIVNNAYNHYNYSNDISVISRSSTGAPSVVTYRVDGPINSVSIFLHRGDTEPTISVSSKGDAFAPVSIESRSFEHRTFYTSIIDATDEIKYLRIQLNSSNTIEALGRVEIEYGGSRSSLANAIQPSFRFFKDRYSNFKYELVINAIRSKAYSVESSSDLSTHSWQTVPFATEPIRSATEVKLFGDNTLKSIYLQTKDTPVFYRIKVME